MRILFVMEHSGVGPLVPAVRLLQARGHSVHLASRRVKTSYSHQELQALAAEGSRITYTRLPRLRNSRWARLTRDVRLAIDYLRYFEPRYKSSTKLRKRAEAQAAPAARRAAQIAGLFGPVGVAALRRGLQLVERCLIPSPDLVRFLADEAPDLVIITPLVDLGSRQADWLRAAKGLGIRTAYPVFSWDNLTNKGLLRDTPDLVLVWNDLQAREAEELHGVSPDRIRVTGAPVCDPWFEWEPSRSREEFCRELGLRADRPIVVYLCSSKFVAPDELAFVRGWIEGLRARGGVFAEAGFLVRPYPDTARRWIGIDLDGPQVRVWPRFGEAPHDEASRRNYFDSIFHAAAVVGINTTAQIESAIVGRPVHTLLAEEFRDTQQGTLHFHYLKADEFGLLHVGRTFEEHAAQLEESLRGREDDGRNERFLRRFVRPVGLERSATELVVEAIEELGSRPAPAPDRGPLLAPLVRLALAPLATLAERGSSQASGTKSRPQGLPARRLRRTVQRLGREVDGAPVVAGPWLEDEIGELLYWVPFLRWTQTTSIGLRERLFVVCRASCSDWYGGIGAGLVELEEAGSREPPEALAARAFDLDIGKLEVFSPAAVAAARRELAGQDPGRRIQHRLLEFALLPTPELPDDLELPDEFVAVQFEAEQVDVAEAVAARARVIGIEALERSAQTAVLARARGFVGTYGVAACLSALLGRPAIVFGAERAEPDDLRIASSFLGRPPCGGFHTIEAWNSPAQAAEQALALVGRRAGALTGV
jgi:hypothetical protein